MTLDLIWPRQANGRALVSGGDCTHCDACGAPTPIALLDAKPAPGDDPETADWERLECADCYGPGYLRMGQ